MYQPSSPPFKLHFGLAPIALRRSGMGKATQADRPESE